jgi:hypothetical protein
MNGALNPFVYVPHKGTKPAAEIQARLQQLRDEAAKKVAQLKRNGYH